MNEYQRPQHTRASLQLIDAPKFGAVLTAPPVLVFSKHTVDYYCGHCSTVLMHSEPGQINNLNIRCTKCGSYNSTDV
jgi:DNA-directed RNA polymerase subunit RPC12/RpoP